MNWSMYALCVLAVVIFLAAVFYICVIAPYWVFPVILSIIASLVFGYALYMMLGGGESLRGNPPDLVTPASNGNVHLTPPTAVPIDFLDPRQA